MDDSKLLYNTVTIVIGGLEVVFVHDKQKRKQHRERLKCMDGCSFWSWGSRTDVPIYVYMYLPLTPDTSMYLHGGGADFGCSGWGTVTH